MKTNELTAYAKKRMTEIGAVAMRINTGAVFDQKSGAYRSPSHETGVPDILACFEGLFFGIEIKSKESGDRYLSLGQYQFCNKIIDAGGRVLVARTPEDIDEWIENGFPNSVLTDYLKKAKK